MRPLVDVPTADGTADAYLARPQSKGDYPGVLLYMDAFGLRQRLWDMAKHISDHGYIVLVPNVFYRSGRAPLIPNLPDLVKPENRADMMEQLGPLMRSLTPQAAMRDAGAYLDFLEQEALASSPVGTTGYCMGGALSLRTAAAYPDRVAAAASFHGGNLATDASDSPHLLADQIQAELYLGHADHDRSMPPEQISRLTAALDAAVVRYTSTVYSGAAHGFTMADTAAYDPEATDRHWKALLALLQRSLRRTSASDPTSSEPTT